ncbi:MAG: sterol desaturase family protein [Acetobacteraceae bacterium]|nr:sterol desaturase family protein [Acetobacteraceae bacterium]
MLGYEPALRLGAFLSVLGLLLLAERLAPWSHPRALGWRRWLPNFGLVALGSVLVRLTFPLGVVAVAVWAQGAGFGLFHWVGLPFWVALPLAIVLLDLIVWAQHVATHKVPVLWRLHRVHHADPEMDASTGLRFHPVELWLSTLLKMAAVALLGAPPEAVLIFEIILNASSLFEHAAIRLPERLDRALAWVIVTPRLHRIHHSERPEETDSHYGFFLSVWDRILGTWRGAPAGELVLGVKGYRATGEQRLWRLLTQPLR